MLIQQEKNGREREKEIKWGKERDERKARKKETERDSMTVLEHRI